MPLHLRVEFLSSGQNRQEGLPGLASLSSQRSTPVEQFERLEARSEGGIEVGGQALDLEGELENRVLANIVWHIGYFP